MFNKSIGRAANRLFSKKTGQSIKKFASKAAAEFPRALRQSDNFLQANKDKIGVLADVLVPGGSTAVNTIADGLHSGRQGFHQAQKAYFAGQ